MFVRESDPRHASDDPLYEPPVPAGATALVVKVSIDHLRVRLDDPKLSREPVKLWQDGLFPDQATNTISALQKL